MKNSLLSLVKTTSRKNVYALVMILYTFFDKCNVSVIRHPFRSTIISMLKF